MNAFALVGLVSGVFSLALAIFTLIKSNKKVHYIWALFLLSVALWGLGIYKFASTLNIESAVFWWRVAEAGVILIPVLLTHFVIEFLNLPRKQDIYVVYIISAIFLYINVFTDYFFGPLRFVFDKFYYITPTIPYTLFIVMFLGLVIYNITNLIQAYKKSHNLVKLQIKYLIFAFSVGFTGGATSFLPVYYVDIIPFYNIGIFLASLLLTYTIFKHQLMNIRILAAYVFIAILNLVSFVYIFASNTLEEYVIKILFFVGTLFISYLLYDSFNKEIKRKEELQILSDKLAHANVELKKLDNAKSEFISIASHQLRTPLTSIKGYISLVTEGTYGKIDKKVKDALSKVYIANERLIQLVENLLNVSRIESGKMEYTFEEHKIEDIIKELMDNFIFAAKKKDLYLHSKLPRKSLPKIVIDRPKIVEVVSNMIDNALKYTGKGGVTIKAEMTISKKSAKDDMIRITVSDTGIGIPAENMPEMFQKFSRGKDTDRLGVSGTGLGMFVAKNIMEAHHGLIWVESDGDGKGSSFIIEIPLKHEE